MHNVLKNANFLDENVKSDTIGRGILPVAKDEQGRTCFLLAKEQHVPYWRGSHKWSAFEGGRHTGESIEETAIREWTEESVASVLPLTIDMLKNKDYICRYTLNVIQNRKVCQLSMNNKYHVTYAMEIPYSEEYASIFERKRDALITLKKTSEHLGNLNADIDSMEDIDVNTVRVKGKNEDIFYNVSKDSENMIQLLELTNEIDDTMLNFPNLPGVTINRYNNNVIKNMKVNEVTQSEAKQMKQIRHKMKRNRTR